MFWKRLHRSFHNDTRQQKGLYNLQNTWHSCFLFSPSFQRRHLSWRFQWRHFVASTLTTKLKNAIHSYSCVIPSVTSLWRGLACHGMEMVWVPLWSYAKQAVIGAVAWLGPLIKANCEHRVMREKWPAWATFEPRTVTQVEISWYLNPH